MRRVAICGLSIGLLSIVAINGLAQDKLDTKQVGVPELVELIEAEVDKFNDEEGERAFVLAVQNIITKSRSNCQKVSRAIDQISSDRARKKIQSEFRFINVRRQRQSTVCEIMRSRHYWAGTDGSSSNPATNMSSNAGELDISGRASDVSLPPLISETGSDY